ncbi:MAG: D-aminoacyl-tRNA deacylase [Pseudomonadota bacterium]
MIALIQRVKQAQVVVDEETIANISQGLLVFIGFEKADTQQQIPKLVDKLINYRIFADDEDKMNLSVKAIQAGILLVPQFTLAADTKKGLRPSFSSSAAPPIAQELFTQFSQQLSAKHASLETGRFGADMQVSLINDGPVTFILTA